MALHHELPIYNAAFDLLGLAVVNLLLRVFVDKRFISKPQYALPEAA